MDSEMYRKDFDKYVGKKIDYLRAGIPEVITDEIIRKSAESFVQNSGSSKVKKDGSVHLDQYQKPTIVLDDVTDPDRNFRNAIGSLALSYLQDCREVDAYCKKKDEPLFQSMIDALPEDWSEHAMIDLHWIFLNRGKEQNPDLFEAVDGWLTEETYGSTD